MRAFERTLAQALIGSALFLAAAGPAYSGLETFEEKSFYDGNTVMRNCEANDVGSLRACLGFLVGVLDAHNTLMAALPARVEGQKKRALICVPLGVTEAQLRQVFLNDMAKVPEQWHFSASSLAIVAFARAWPCAN